MPWGVTLRLVYALWTKVIADQVDDDPLCTDIIPVADIDRCRDQTRTFYEQNLKSDELCSCSFTLLPSTYHLTGHFCSHIIT